MIILSLFAGTKCCNYLYMSVVTMCYLTIKLESGICYLLGLDSFIMIHILETEDATRVCDPVMMSFSGTFDSLLRHLCTFTFTDMGPIKNETMFNVPHLCK